MNCILINIRTEKSSILETLIDDKLLKEYAYGAKYKNVNLEYDNILVPIEPADMANQEFIQSYDILKQHIVLQLGDNYSDDIFYSIFKVIRMDLLQKAKSLSINILEEFNYDDINIFYTDGSFKKDTETASYACCQLLNESQTGLNDEFTGKTFEYHAYSGKIEKGTNNIGELTGIKVAVENFGDKKYQLIISDSIYGIKSYREYIHVWKNNNYRAYNKKEIKNKDLIIETYDKIKEQQASHIVLLKWTKGHANNSFNEKCDELAKKEVGI